LLGEEGTEDGVEEADRENTGAIDVERKSWRRKRAFFSQTSSRAFISASSVCCFCSSLSAIAGAATFDSRGGRGGAAAGVADEDMVGVELDEVEEDDGGRTGDEETEERAEDEVRDPDDEAEEASATTEKDAVVEKGTGEVTTLFGPEPLLTLPLLPGLPELLPLLLLLALSSFLRCWRWTISLLSEPP